MPGGGKYLRNEQLNVDVANLLEKFKYFCIKQQWFKYLVFLIALLFCVLTDRFLSTFPQSSKGEKMIRVYRKTVAHQTEFSSDAQIIDDTCFYLNAIVIKPFVTLTIS